MAQSGVASAPGTASPFWRVDPVLIRDGLPGDPDDKQSHYIEAAVNGVVIASIYLPNGNPQPGPKFNYSLTGSTGCSIAAGLLEQDVPLCLLATTTSCRRTSTSTQ
jgi:exodeoxyribonuclease-3